MITLTAHFFSLFLPEANEAMLQIATERFWGQANGGGISRQTRSPEGCNSLLFLHPVSSKSSPVILETNHNTELKHEENKI